VGGRGWVSFPKMRMRLSPRGGCDNIIGTAVLMNRLRRITTNNWYDRQRGAIIDSSCTSDTLETYY